MSEEIFEILRRAGFIKGNTASKRTVQNAPPGQIFDICEAIKERSLVRNVKLDHSHLTHAASVSLGGGRTPCSSYDCRAQNISKLMQFSAFYSDKVYIQNFLADLTGGIIEYKTFNINSCFYDDIKLLTSIEPLIEAGNIQLIHYGDICPHCMFSKHITDTTEEEIANLRAKLTKEFYKTVKCDMRYEYGELTLELSGPDSILRGHGESFSILGEQRREQLFTMIPEIVHKAMQKGLTKISPRVARLINLSHSYIEDVIDSIMFELGSANELRTAYLSDNEHEISTIKQITKDPFAQKKTALLAKHLTCAFPFVHSCNPTELLSIRSREQESFIKFRAAFDKALAEYTHIGSELSERDAELIYLDIVRPRLAELDLVIKNANESFRKSMFRKALSWTGSISVGILAGIYSQPIVTGAAAFNAIKTGAEIIDEVLNKSDTENALKSDDFYYLWKVKESSRKRPKPH